MSKRETPWVRRDASERRRIVNAAFVERASLACIAAKMDELREDHREGKETVCMVVVGEPGVGKSKFLRRYAAASGTSEVRTTEGVTRIQPVVYAELEPDTTVIEAAVTILKSMMGDNAPSGSVVKNRILPAQLKIRRVELVIIDEFQHVGQRGAAKTRNKTADWVKSITKKLNIPVVMAGVPVVAQLVEDNDQLETITPHKFGIPNYDHDDADARAGLLEFLEELDKELSFDATGDLHDPDRGGRLHLASGGNLRYLHRIVAQAARYAIEDGSPCINDDHLREACDEAGMHPSCFDNPFHEPYSEAA